VKRLFVVLLGLTLVSVICATAMAAPQGGAKDTIVLSDAPNGAVTFDHKKHTATAGKCEVCHHAAKPEKAAKAAQQSCRDCHTKTAEAPMKTKRQAAFHNPAAQSGICIDCHKKEAAAGKKAPTKCGECHKKAA
jgi:Class III cytochrome C family